MFNTTISRGLLLMVLLTTSIPALARTEDGRPRTYTGGPLTGKMQQVKCLANARRCFSTTPVASSSSSVEGIRGRVVDHSKSTWVPFLNRYIELNTGWTGEATQTRATFTKNTANPNDSGSSFSVELFEYLECDAQKLEKRMEDAWQKVGKKSPELVSIGRAYGAQGLAFGWVEPLPDNKKERSFCYVPPGHILTTRVRTLDSDFTAKTEIERKLGMQLLRADRMGRRR